MNDEVFCESCGKSIAADATFCEHCGTALVTRLGAGGAPPEPSTVAATAQPAMAAGPTGPGFTPQQAAERLEAFTPGVSELASQLADQVKTPVVATALAAGALAAGAVFAIGVVLALVLPDQSLLGVVDSGKGVIAGGFAQMLNFLQVGYGDRIGKLGPALFVIFPIGACAVAAASQARRTHGMSPGARLAGGAAVGVVFGLLMLIPALAAGSLGGVQSGGTDPNALSAVLLGILWGSLGGVLGTYHVVRGELQPGFLDEFLPATVIDVSRTIFVALRPLALVLVVATVVGTMSWAAATVLKPELREGRSTLMATVDHAAYGVDHGVHWTELGGLAEFHSGSEGPFASAEVGSPLAAPVPVSDAGEIKVDGQGQYRIFGFSKAMPAYTFIPLVIFLIGLLLLLALNAGFAVARLQRPSTQLIAAGWGCLVGPIWATSMVILNALVAKDIFGRAVGDSVFGTFLIGGLVVGAIGGLLSTQTPRGQAVDPAVFTGTP